jgi:phenylpropionate dioxygenase-like ring-hydroxylating dioxygenase large terminal subunit
MSAGPAVRPRGFRGHEQRDAPAPDPELTAVGPDTPCGEWLRRSWQPVAMASELADLPLPVRILGEDLVLFRDKSGQCGLLHRHCSHRGASLEYGIIMERGIACCYHGWHYDIDGTLLATPAEPNTTLCKRIVHGAYPVREFAGIVFAYLGPAALLPPFPEFDTQAIAGTTAVPFSLVTPCNWLQVYENTQDPVHVVYLHTKMTGAQFGDASGAVQEIEYRETPLGMINIQTRCWQGHYWTRLTDSILPNGNQTGAIWEAADRTKVFQRTAMLRWMVPIDDTRTTTIGWRYFRAELDPLGLGDAARVGKQTIDFIGQTGEERSEQARQRVPGDYEVQVSQRPVTVHALENLATSDRGVAMLRRLIRRGIRGLAGETAPRTHAPGADGRVGTYCQDTVWPAPAAIDASALRSFGAKVADVLLATAHETPEARRAALATALAAHFGA